MTLNHNSPMTKGVQREVSLYYFPVFPLFLRHLLLSPITDKLLRYKDLWSHPVQIVPFVLSTKYFHWDKNMFFIRIPSVHIPSTYYQLCNSCNAYNDATYKAILHKKKITRLVINFKLAENHDRFSITFH